MRFVALLLATIVLFLAFKPAIGGMVLSYNGVPSCCVKTCDAMPSFDVSDEEEPKGSCNGNSCNPFQGCGTTFLICLTTNDVNQPKAEISTKAIFSYQSIASSKFITDFWQPPKFV
jgi:hypothetical protein